MTTYAVLDVGGTSIKLGAVRDEEVLIGQSVPAHAHDDAQRIVAQLRTAADAAVGCARRLADAHGSESIGGLAIDFPSPFDFERATPLLRGLNKYDAIYGVDLRNELSRDDGVRIEFVRDSEAVGVGEAVYGAGRAQQRVLTIALGTGMGSCLTDGGEPVFEAAGQVVDQLHRRSTPHGRADDVFSARGLGPLLDADPRDLGRVLSGDDVSIEARAAMADFGDRLGAFLADTAELQRDLVVIAGGIAGAFDLFGPALRSELDVPCEVGRLGASAPMLGAVRLAFGDSSAAP